MTNKIIFIKDDGTQETKEIPFVNGEVPRKGDSIKTNDKEFIVEKVLWNFDSNFDDINKNKYQVIIFARELATQDDDDEFIAPIIRRCI